MKIAYRKRFAEASLAAREASANHCQSLELLHDAAQYLKLALLRSHRLQLFRKTLFRISHNEVRLGDEIEYFVMKYEVRLPRRTPIGTQVLPGLPTRYVNEQRYGPVIAVMVVGTMREDDLGLMLANELHTLLERLPIVRDGLIRNAKHLTKGNAQDIVCRAHLLIGALGGLVFIFMPCVRGLAPRECHDGHFHSQASQSSNCASTPDDFIITVGAEYQHFLNVTAKCKLHLSSSFMTLIKISF